MIEHDLGIMTSHGHLTHEQLKYLNEQKGKNSTSQKPPEKPVLCPFTRRKCAETCALCENGTCCIVSGGQINPRGLCPFADNDQHMNKHTCENCTLYHDGKCAFIFRGRKRG